MITAITKKTMLCLGVLFALISCKKDVTQFNGQASGNQTAEAKSLIDSRKMLLAIDFANNNNIISNAIYRITGITSPMPNKLKIFQGKNGFAITNVCPGIGVNNAYFFNKKIGANSVDDGIWNVTMDGQKFKKVIGFVGLNGNVGQRLSIDRINGRIYWSEGPGIDQQKFIMSCKTDGSDPKTISINGFPEFDDFVVDGEGQRIFIKTEGSDVIGSCDLNGNIITPVVAKFPFGQNYTFNLSMDLDVVAQKIFVHGGYILGSTGMNDNNQLLFFDMQGGQYYNLTFDFDKSTKYYPKGSAIFSSSIMGGPEKQIIGGFNDLRWVSSIFTDK